VHFAALMRTPELRLIPLDPQERVPMGVWTPARRRAGWWA
jgi:hypothetical protein